MNEITRHTGTVVSVSDGMVKVEMHVMSACGSCKAHDKCGFGETAEKIVEIATDDWNSYSVGEKVVVSVNEGLGLLAVLLAYVLPAIVIVASVALLSAYTGSELLSALLPIAIVAVYYIVLYLFRSRLQNKFGFGISKRE